MGEDLVKKTARQTSEKYKAARRARGISEKAKEAQRKRQASPEYKEKAKSRRQLRKVQENARKRARRAKKASAKISEKYPTKPGRSSKEIKKKIAATRAQIVKEQKTDRILGGSGSGSTGSGGGMGGGTWQYDKFTGKMRRKIPKLAKGGTVKKPKSWNY